MIGKEADKRRIQHASNSAKRWGVIAIIAAALFMILGLYGIGLALLILSGMCHNNMKHLEMEYYILKIMERKHPR